MCQIETYLLYKQNLFRMSGFFSDFAQNFRFSQIFYISCFLRIPGFIATMTLALHKKKSLSLQRVKYETNILLH